MDPSRLTTRQAVARRLRSNGSIEWQHSAWPHPLHEPWPIEKPMSHAHFPTDYDEYAPTYAKVRSAVPWVVAPLAALIAPLAPGATVLEIGCGTGNYIGSLAEVRPDLSYVGFDLSERMLSEARNRTSGVSFLTGDAAQAFPCRDRVCELAFAVDVVHHITDLPCFFTESARVLGAGGHLAVVTDSEENMRQRSLTRYFPDILPIELRRYPSLALLHRLASEAGFGTAAEEPASGQVPLTDAFVDKLAAKCSSAIRLLTAAQHEAGMDRVRRAQTHGEHWSSCYTIVVYALA
jgi:SAM-dependent methyltransferase